MVSKFGKRAEQEQEDMPEEKPDLDMPDKVQSMDTGLPIIQLRVIFGTHTSTRVPTHASTPKMITEALGGWVTSREPTMLDWSKF